MFLEKIRAIAHIFKKPELYPEELTAYFHRLPDKIQVDWFRDEKFIVGTIRIDGEDPFMTQGYTAREFVEMVNEAIYVVYEIPEEYFKVLGITKFTPSPEEFGRLNNVAIKKSTLKLKKQLAAA